MLSAAAEAVHLSASFVTSLFASFCQNLCKSNNFVFLLIRSPHKTISKLRIYDLTALVLSIINWAYCSYRGIHKSGQKISRSQTWPVFQTNAKIPDLPELKSGTSLAIGRDCVKQINISRQAHLATHSS